MSLLLIGNLFLVIMISQKPQNRKFLYFAPRQSEKAPVYGYHAADAPAAEMTAEELYQTGRDAFFAKDYGKAMQYYQLTADLGVAAAWRRMPRKQPGSAASGHMHFMNLTIPGIE